jgi:hypothetical protein
METEINKGDVVITMESMPGLKRDYPYIITTKNEVFITLTDIRENTLISFPLSVMDDLIKVSIHDYPWLKWQIKNSFLLWA